MIIGIDPGLNGGACCMANNGEIIALVALQTRHTAGRNELDGDWLAQWIELCFHDSDDECICMEDIGNRYPNQLAMRSCALGGGIIIGVGDALSVPVYRYQPKLWQKAMLGRCSKGETKSRALQVAQQLWPTQIWTATPRCTTPHDGIIDATLITEYHRRITSK